MSRALPFALTADLVRAATGGRLVAGAAERVFDGVSIDSRALQPGALFVAIRGERDGHDFIADAIARGAAGLLVSTPPRDAGEAAVVLVPDTLEALQALGRRVRRDAGCTVVAITGSAGKTTTKEAIAELLGARYRVFRSHGNLNNHLGVPLSLIELRKGYDVAAIELGMNHAGEIRTLVRIAEPDVRVWTNVGDAHIGHFGSREAIAAAKAEILEGAGPDTVAIVNADDPLVMAHVRSFPGRVITFGEAAGADVRAASVADEGFDGSTAEVDTPVGRLQLRIPLPGRAHLSNVLAGVAVAVHLGVSREAIAERVARLRPVERRGASTTLASGARMIDDSYNASPAAVVAALAALAATPAAGRRIAVLGEMRELGAEEGRLHEACGRAAAATVDLLVAVGGPAADGFLAGALDAGLAADRTRRFGDSTAAGEFVAAAAGPGDLILIKGSRATRMDRVADRLREVA